MQYQIREPEGFARMLEMIIETGASVFWQVWIFFSYVHMRRMEKIRSL